MKLRALNALSVKKIIFFWARAKKKSLALIHIGLDQLTTVPFASQGEQGVLWLILSPSKDIHIYPMYEPYE